MDFIRSDKDTHFRDSLAQFASEYEDIQLGSIPHGRVDSFIRSIRILSIQNLAWTVVFYSRRRNYEADYDLDTSIEFQDFAATDAIATATSYLYAVSGLEIPYRDEDVLGELHVGLHNRSSTAKNAGDSGMIHMTFGVT